MSPKPDIRDPMNKPIKRPQDDVAAPKARHKTTQVMVGNVAVGGRAPLIVQPKTHTGTAAVAGPSPQVAALARARSAQGRTTVPPRGTGGPVPPIPAALPTP